MFSTHLWDNFVTNITDHRAWFLYSLFMIRAMVYPLAAANNYTLFAATLAGVLYTVFTPTDATIERKTFVHHQMSDRDGIMHAYVGSPLTQSVYFFMGMWLLRLNLFSGAASLLLRRTWIRLGGLVFLVAVLTPCFVPPYQGVYDYIWTSPNATTGQQTTGPWQLPVVAVFFAGIALCTPVSKLPIITTGGTRTLIGYLLLGHGSVSNLGQCLIDILYTPVFGPDVANWVGFFTLVPFLSLFATSELMNVASWPVTQPTWAVALVTGNEMAVPPVVTRWSKAAAGYMGSCTPACWERFGEYLLTAPLFFLFTLLVLGIKLCGGGDD